MRLCWTCWRAQKDEELRDDAYRAGYQAGRRSVSIFDRPSVPAFDRDLLRDAIQLTHPDRNPERLELANRVTAALLELLQATRDRAA